MAIEVVPFSSTNNLEAVVNQTNATVTNGSFNVDLNIGSDITGGGTAAFQTDDLLLLFHSVEQNRGSTIPNEATGNTHNTANFSPSISYGALSTFTSSGFIDLGYSHSLQGTTRRLCVGAYALVIPSTDTLQNGTLRMTYTGLGTVSTARTCTLKCFILRGVDVSDFASASSLGVAVARSSAATSPDNDGDMEWVSPTSGSGFTSSNYTGTITQFLHGAVRRNGGILASGGNNANPEDNTNNTLPTSALPGSWEQDTEGAVTEGGQDGNGGNSSHRRITYFNTNRTFSGLSYPYAFRMVQGSAHSDTNSGGTLSVILREAVTTQIREISSTIEGSCDTSGNVEVIHPISGSLEVSAEATADITAVSPTLISATAEGSLTAEGLLSRIETISGSLEGTAETSANITIVNPTQVSGSVEGSLTTQGLLSRVESISGSLEASVTTSADLIPVQEISGSAEGSLSTECLLSRVESITGSVEGSVTTSANLTPIYVITGSLEGSATTQAGINVDTTISGSVSGSLDSSANVDRVALVSGDIESALETTAGILVDTTISGTATGTLSTTADVEITGQATLTGSITGSLSTEGALLIDTTISGTATGSVTSNADLDRITEVSSSIEGSLEATGSILQTISISASSEAALEVSADIIGEGNLTGSVTSSLTCSGSIDRTTSVSGSALGSIEVTANLTDVDSISGTATGALQSTANLTRLTSITGSASGSLAVSGGVTATSLEEISGTVSVSGSISGSADVTKLLNGQIEGSVSATLEIDLVKPIEAVAQSSLDLSGFLSVDFNLSGAIEATGTVNMGITVSIVDSLLKQGAVSLVSLTDITEEITYYPGGNLSDPRSIRVVVHRFEPDVLEYTLDETMVVQVELWIANDATKGITTIDPGQDLADVVVTEGKAAERVRIVEILDHDPGMVHVLGVR